MLEVNKIYCTDALSGLKTLPDNSIDCCVTSPPYWGLRDYGHSDQIGLEKSPEEFITKITAVFQEVKRVLKPTGTLWLNIGDSYASGKSRYSKSAQSIEGGGYRPEKYGVMHCGGKPDLYHHPTLKDKDLIGIPWKIAFALQESGWWLRQDIIWHKPNPMPESVADRCTKAHEYIFLLSKSASYYFDANSIKTNSKDAIADQKRYERQTWQNKNTPDELRNGLRPRSTFGNRNGALNGLHSGNEYYGLELANKRSVWTVNTKPFKEAHFATFPEELILDCIKAGCLENGIVLDPFMGAGTTGLVARKLNRNYIGFELNQKYCDLAERRIKQELGMFL